MTLADLDRLQPGCCLLIPGRVYFGFDGESKIDEVVTYLGRADDIFKARVFVPSLGRTYVLDKAYLKTI